MHHNFDHDYSVVSQTGLILFIQGINYVADYVNPILGTLSVSLSIFYILKKIHREFFRYEEWKDPDDPDSGKNNKRQSK